MSWFKEQVEARLEQDHVMLEDACEDLLEAVTGKPAPGRTYNEFAVTQSAMDELLSYYHFKKVEIPKEITELTRQLDYVLHPLGMMWREVTLQKNWYRYASGAMLGKRADDGQTIVLIPKKSGGYHFLDVKTGKRVTLNKKTEGMIADQAYCVYVPFPQKKLEISDLLKYILQNISRQTVAFFVVIAGMLTGLGMIMPKLTYLLYSNVVENKNVTLLLSILTFAVCIGISSTLLKAMKTLLNTKLNTQLNVSVQAATMERLLTMPVSFFRGYSSGELSSRMESINKLCSSIVTEVFSISITSILSILYVTQIFLYARSLLVPSLVITFVTVGYSILVTIFEVEETRKEMELEAKNAGMTYGVISGIQKIKLAGAEMRVFARWMKAYAKRAKIQYHPSAILMHRDDIVLMISLLGQFILFYLAAATKVSVAEYGAFMSAYGVVSGAFLELVQVAATAAGIRPILETARPIMDQVPESTEQKKMVRKLNGTIEFNNVSFRYTETMPKVIDNLSMKIKKGEYVAIVGKTGCGKSTLVRLLLGFEQPQRGAIYYDGQDISKLDLQSLRRNIGTVMQDGRLFQGDIFSNITISAPEATLEDAFEAAEKAGLKEDIEELPMGMNTIIAEGGMGISGGQRQRILIARAIASKPKLLILDEATSALDNITQKQVSQALGELKCTRIVIAHRLSTIRQCDRILYLENGKIVEEGTYEQLEALNGKFAELVRRQQLS